MDAGNGDVVARWLTSHVCDVAWARQQAARCLRHLDCDDDSVDTAACIVSELVTNALCHGAPPVELRVWPCPLRCVVIEVCDTGARLPALPSPRAPHEVNPLDISGRGLPLVTVLSGGLCGVARYPFALGKSVWVGLRARGFLTSTLAVGALVRARAESRALTQLSATQWSEALAAVA